jgi:hypothetical protein
MNFGWALRLEISGFCERASASHKQDADIFAVFSGNEVN